jgi:hypothetical protein
MRALSTLVALAAALPLAEGQSARGQTAGDVQHLIGKLNEVQEDLEKYLNALAYAKGTIDDI